MKKKRSVGVTVSLLVVALLLTYSAFAVTITLKSGEKITGEIIEGDEEHIKIIVNGQPIIFPVNEIDNIEDPDEEIPPPMFGNSPKSAQRKASDEKFIKSIVQEAGSREAAAKEMVVSGWQYYDQRNLITSMKRFNQAWLLDPNNADIYWGFGLILLDQGDLSKAIEMFDKSLRLNPNNKDVYLNRAHAYGKLRNFNKAIADYTTAIEIDPNDAQFYNDRGVTYFHSGKYEKSWNDVQIALNMGYNVPPGFLAALKSKGYSE